MKLFDVTQSYDDTTNRRSKLKKCTYMHERDERILGKCFVFATQCCLRYILILFNKSENVFDNCLQYFECEVVPMPFSVLYEDLEFHVCSK